MSSRGSSGTLEDFLEFEILKSLNSRIQSFVADSNDIRYPRALIACPIRGLPTRSFNSRSRRGMQPTTSMLLHEGAKGKRCVVMELEREMWEDNGRGGIITCVTVPQSTRSFAREYNLLPRADQLDSSLSDYS